VLQDLCFYFFRLLRNQPLWEGASLNTEPVGQGILRATELSSFQAEVPGIAANQMEGRPPLRSRMVRELPAATLQQAKASARALRDAETPKGLPLDPSWRPLSPWSRSMAKRVFDCACVILATPVLVPVILLIGAAVRLTSRGPVLFLQKRIGRHGKPFTIVKFRTMAHVSDRAHHPVTTSDNQSFTSIGPFLRRSKLDELPQVANVLLGHMSLVGPRPKMQEHVIFDLPCRPGITGMATTVFACEETVLARLPKNHLDTCYHSVVLPAKRQLDSEYMAQATFLSDFRLLVKSVLRRWDMTVLESLIFAAVFEIENEKISPRSPEIPRTISRIPIPASATHSASAEHVSAF
jgi:lipopolysaccharide/colanic/teichoic acid biosynthesis glycosyltransferase